MRVFCPFKSLSSAGEASHRARFAPARSRMLSVIELKEHIISIERCDCGAVGQVISPRSLFGILDQLEILAQEEAGGNYPGSVVSLFKYKHWTIIPAHQPSLARHVGSRRQAEGTRLFPGQVCLSASAPQGASISSLTSSKTVATLGCLCRPSLFILLLVLQTFGCFVGTCLNLRPEFPVGWDAGGFLRRAGLFSQSDLMALEETDWNAPLC